jgi:hypothetical protein
MEPDDERTQNTTEEGYSESLAPKRGDNSSTPFQLQGSNEEWQGDSFDGTHTQSTRPMDQNEEIEIGHLSGVQRAEYMQERPHLDFQFLINDEVDTATRRGRGRPRTRPFGPKRQRGRPRKDVKLTGYTVSVFGIEE